jgi:hypothetical protein
MAGSAQKGLPQLSSINRGNTALIVPVNSPTATQKSLHAHRHTTGYGHIYQGRFKSFPIEEDESLLKVLRYVERNALRANLVERAQDWRWSSLWRRLRR